MKLHWTWQLKCHSGFLPPPRQTLPSLGTRGALWRGSRGTYLSAAGRRNNEVGDDIVVPQILGAQMSVGRLHVVLIAQTVESCLCYVHSPRRDMFRVVGNVRLWKISLHFIHFLFIQSFVLSIVLVGFSVGGVSCLPGNTNQVLQ